MVLTARDVYVEKEKYAGMVGVAKTHACMSHAYQARSLAS